MRLVSRIHNVLPNACTPRRYVHVHNNSEYSREGRFGEENIWRFADKKCLAGKYLAITAKKHHLTNHVHNFGGFYFCGIKTKQPISHKTGKFDNLAIWRLILI